MLVVDGGDDDTRRMMYSGDWQYKIGTIQHHHHSDREARRGKSWNVVAAVDSCAEH